MQNETQKREQLLTYISDIHKDVYGFRPRGSYDHLSIDELEKECDSLGDELDEIFRMSRIERKENWIALKKHFAKLVEMGAKDFRQSLKWDMEAEGANGDFDYYCYLKKISYGKADALERLAA